MKVAFTTTLIAFETLLVIVATMCGPRYLHAGTIDTTQFFEGQLSAGLVHGGTFVADASKLTEFTLIVFGQNGAIGRAVVLATDESGVPVGPPLWQGPGIQWPTGLPLRDDGNLDLTYQPNIPLVPGKTYFVGMDFGAFGVGAPGLIFFTASSFFTDPLPGVGAWGSNDGISWFTMGPPGSDIAARIVMEDTEDPTPSELVSELVTTVSEFELHGGISDSLEAKLDAVLAHLDAGRNTSAINVLNAFINSVEAQRGKKLTNPQADSLIAAAQQIILAIGG